MSKGSKSSGNGGHVKSGGYTGGLSTNRGYSGSGASSGQAPQAPKGGSGGSGSGGSSGGSGSGQGSGSKK